MRQITAAAYSAISTLLLVITCGGLGNSAQACNLSSMLKHPATARVTSPAATQAFNAFGNSDKLPHHIPTPVGLWESEFSGADGSNARGFETVYADGNELLIDNSAPATDNVCSGVWEQTGPLTYKINHPSWDFDANGNLIGIVILISTINIDLNGNAFTGTATVTVYDPSLTTVEYQTTGTLKGFRITTNSSPL